MKKNLFYLFALVLSMSVFSACSSDDDDDNVAAEIVGNYTGTMSVQAPSGTETVDNQLVTVKATSGNQVTIEIINFTVLGQTIPKVEVKDCVVAKNGSNYTLSGSGTALLFPVAVSGTVSGKTLNLAVDVTSPLGTITANFAGTKD